MDWTQTLLIVLVVGLAGWSLYQSIQNGRIKSLNLPEIVGSIETAIPLATELRDVSEMVVFEVEQLRRDPKHNISNDEAFKMAFDKIKGWFPTQTEGLTPEKINTAIQAAVLLASQASNAIETAKDKQLGSLLSGGTENK